MSIGDIISVVLLCLQIGPAFLLIGLGLRYLFYHPDHWNLDRIYEKYFRGRRRKKYRRFTQSVGLSLLIVGLLYTWIAVWPVVEEFLVSES